MYSELKRLLVENIKHKFQDKNWHMGYSEKIMLFLDFISCPFVNIDDKREIVSLLSLNEKDAPTAVDAKNELINSISGKKKWFVDWEDEDWLEKRLRKKEYTFPYN